MSWRLPARRVVRPAPAAGAPPELPTGVGTLVRGQQVPGEAGPWGRRWRGLSGAEVGKDDLQPATVHHGVVGGEHEDVLLRPGPHYPGTDRRRPGQVERSLRLEAQRLVDQSSPFRFVMAAEVLDDHRHRTRRMEHGMPAVVG
ncbi:hypothetical protein V1633_00350 [Plantactinospora sonchi]|uniref:Uncharacterized protein n=1 Tax=Plantactinospora sonchi TaxID=1544735 RepID=A0ABU7RKB4_9ACTN